MGDRIILVQEEPRGPSVLIELAVANGENRVPFLEVDNLKSDTEVNVIIKALRLITSDILVGPVILPGVNAPLSELQKMTLVLYSEGWEKAMYIPLLTLTDVATPGTFTPHRYHATRFADWKKVSWTKSYIQFANGTASVGAYNLLFDCEYQRFNAQGVEVKGGV